MKKRDRERLIQTMRNLMWQNWTSEALIVDTAAQVIGGDEKAQREAQKVWDENFGIFKAN